MRVKQHLFDRLDRLEPELRDMLLPALERTAAGRDDLLFITPTTNPYPGIKWLAGNTSSAGEKILSMAEEILALATQLGESTEGLLAARVVHYFKKACDLADPHRGAPAGVARQFLKELGAGG